MPTPPSRTDSTLVIGLGRFGSAVAAVLGFLLLIGGSWFGWQSFNKQTPPCTTS